MTGDSEYEKTYIDLLRITAYKQYAKSHCGKRAAPFNKNNWQAEQSIILHPDPEAYTLHAAIQGWVANETNEQIRERAAQAYHKFQKCGIKGARNLLLTGW